MASPILHIKDSYYFEIPKPLWRYRALDEVPQFLRDAHPEASLADFQHALDGKIVIPQPFGTLRNLYQRESGFAISRFMIMELVVGVILVFLFVRLAGKLRHGAPKGKLANMLEAMLLYVRDNIARPAIDSHDHHGDDHHGEGHHGEGHRADAHAAAGHGHESHGHAAHAAKSHAPVHEGDKFVPLLWTVFFFILISNLFGLIPWTGAATGSWSVTLALASITFGTVLISGIIKFGLVGFWLNQVPSMDLPLLLSPLKLVIFAIEVVGLLIKHLVLSVRLLANMFAGHIVLLGIMALAFSVEGAASNLWGLTATISVIGSTLFSILELFVAFLQAYVFTFLSALFIGAAVHRH